MLEDIAKGAAVHRAYKYMGCQFDRITGRASFRVWAPGADAVYVTGRFNGWDISAGKMQRNAAGIWETELSGVEIFDSYKFYIERAGKGVFKSDPYAYHSETRENTNSKVYPIESFSWLDQKYMQARRQANIYRSPVNIYEAHIASWKKDKSGHNYSYRRFADEIVPYLNDMGYTHLELMGIAEYPYDKSWGYQVTGYYAPTSRYGTPEDFVYMVDKLHRGGIGLILDWVPGHFPKNENGLYMFDGGPLYEPQDTYRREHKEWGTCTFDYSKPEVRDFLISNALMWFDIYHVDGLRVDAVASMLYLDYGRKKGEWKPNKFGGNGNLEAEAFLKELNTEVFARFPDIMMIAEESTAWPNVTMPVYMGGLGFNFKWNMGWMNDNLEYAKTDPLFRKGVHNKLTFTMTYAFSENFVLPISHDEVVYGKCSLLDKMSGSYEQKFAGLRNFLMNMYSHPGKKLIFMGTELASFDEWDAGKQLYWDYLNIIAHRDAKEFIKTLNHLYRKYPAFWEIDDSWKGFEWLVADDSAHNIIAYERKDTNNNRMLCIYNFSPVSREYTLGAVKGTYKRVLNSDLSGWDKAPELIKAKKRPHGGRDYSISLELKGLSGVYLYMKSGKKETVMK